MKKAFILFFACFYSSLFSSETTFLIIRHGQTCWNITKRYQGHTNTPLNATGIAQAKDLAEVISSEHSNVTTIYSSDLDRAYVTALETAQVLNLEVKKREALREIYFGDAEGKTLEEVEDHFGNVKAELNERYPDRSKRWDYTHIPNAETNRELLKRVSEELKIIARAHPEEKVAVFSHGRVIRVLLSEILDNDEFSHLPNCAVVEVLYSSDNNEQAFKFISIN